MDGYPADYVGHNLPFVVLFGLGSTQAKPLKVEAEYPYLQEKGIYISSQLPSVTGDVAEKLLNSFREFDARDASWNSRPGKGKMGTMGFTYRSVGRVG
jgi:trafficking protein particle complex subunit 11